MAAHQFKRGNENINWKGGRVISSHGYVLIKMPDHPFADKNGYVYEHRLVMEQKLGRYLNHNEIIHHIDGNKQNNLPDNLDLAVNIADHWFKHRKRFDLRKPGEENIIVSCACGCKTEFLKYDESGRPRKYVSGHNINKRSAVNG